MTYIHPLFFVALIVLLGWLGRTGIKTLARSRSLSARRLLFVVGVVLFLALAGGASWTLVRVEQTGVIRCPGTRCGGSAALASEQPLYWSFFAFHPVVLFVFLAMAVIFFFLAVRSMGKCGITMRSSRHRRVEEQK